jgi:ABC-type nitrate/sulfonate/bicarbonate transport system substrate-binding protein
MKNKEVNMNQRTVVITRCPIGSASEIVLRKGWLQEAYDNVGVKLEILQDMPLSEHRKHFTQEPPLVFREGGNVPPIWAQSIGNKNLVIGFVRILQSHGILVSPDSKISTVEQLRGKRLSVPLSQGPLDPMRAMVLRGYQTILDGCGIDPKEVTFVDIPTTQREHKHVRDEEKPGMADIKAEELPQHSDEIKALQDGRVDAFFSHRGLLALVEEKGFGRVLIDIAKTPLNKTNNIYPQIITVRRDFAEENPDLVVIYLQQLLKAAEWAKEHRTEAVEIAARAQYGVTVEEVKKSREEDFFTRYKPDFHPDAVEQVRTQKEFLLQKGFIKNDFDYVEWLDSRFLEESLKTTNKE